MRITKITTYELQHKLERPFAYSQFWRHMRQGMLLELTTDEGIVGWGEGIYGPAAAAAAIHSEYAHILKVIDPLDIATTWERLYNYTRDYGRRGVMVVAISAIDISLFDIAGKALGMPAYKLLGGTFRSKVPVYATGCYPHDLDQIQEEVVEEAAQHVAAGMRGVKIKIGFGIEADCDLIHAVRQALGPSVRLMIDANHAYTADQAIRLGRAIEDCDIYWFEEPVVPEDLVGYRTVRQALPIPIAGGEAEYTRWGFRDLFQAEAVDIAQPDVALAGGLSECRHIAYLASAFGIRCNPHAWGTCICLAATMHLLAAIPDYPPRLLPEVPLLEADRTPNPLRDDLAFNPVRIEDGYAYVPEQAGIGIEINREELAKYVVNKRETIL